MGRECGKLRIHLIPVHAGTLPNFGIPGKADLAFAGVCIQAIEGKPAASVEGIRHGQIGFSRRSAAQQQGDFPNRFLLTGGSIDLLLQIADFFLQPFQFRLEGQLLLRILFDILSDHRCKADRLLNRLGSAFGLGLPELKLGIQGLNRG